MNLKLLKAFITIADAGSFSKAAERLFISQPALSQNIKQLESHFAIALIKRTPHSFSLTEAGKELYQHAVQVVAITDTMEEKMGAFRSCQDNNLCVGATSVIGGYSIPCSIFIFKRRHPNAIVKLRLGSRRYILEQLRDNLIDIAVIEGEKPEDTLHSVEVHTEEMVVVAPYEDQWRNQSTPFSLSEFCHVPLIMREEGSATRWAIEHTLRQTGLSLSQLNIIMELNSVDSIKAAVGAGHGFSILPRVAVKKDLFNKTFCQLQIDELLFKQCIYVVYKKKNLRTVAADFLKLMKSPENGFC